MHDFREPSRNIITEAGRRVLNVVVESVPQ